MSIALQALVLCLLLLFGELVSAVLPFPMPGSIIAMAALFFLLLSGRVKTEKLQGVTAFLQNNMILFFLPPGVMIMAELPLFKRIGVPLLIICILSTVLTFAATAGTAIAVMRLQEYLRSKKSKKGGT